MSREVQLLNQGPMLASTFLQGSSGPTCDWVRGLQASDVQTMALPQHHQQLCSQMVSWEEQEPKQVFWRAHRPSQQHAAILPPTPASSSSGTPFKQPSPLAVTPSRQAEPAEDFNSFTAEEQEDLAQLTAQLEEQKRTLVVLLEQNKLCQQRIRQLHAYNEIKDVGQMLIGKIAEAEGCKCKELYPRFGLELTD